MIEISGAISAISATVATLKTAVAARDEAKVEAAISDLKDRLFDLQGANLELVEKLHVAKLELHAVVHERNQLQAKLVDRGNYALFNLMQRPGEFWVYRYQGNDSSADGGGTPVHYLCQTCFHDERKSVLNRTDTEIGALYSCLVCKTHEYA